MCVGCDVAVFVALGFGFGVFEASGVGDCDGVGVAEGVGEGVRISDDAGDGVAVSALAGEGFSGFRSAGRCAFESVGRNSCHASTARSATARALPAMMRRATVRFTLKW